jgi:hypothetical protein
LYRYFDDNTAISDFNDCFIADDFSQLKLVHQEAT